VCIVFPYLAEISSSRASGFPPRVRLIFLLKRQNPKNGLRCLYLTGEEQLALLVADETSILVHNKQPDKSITFDSNGIDTEMNIVAL
jgi:hypothetical protein